MCFQDDFEYALEGDFEFEGEYAHAELLTNAPNPGLLIDGVGLLGLPLSASDAKRIIDTSEQAPFGQGAETVVNKDVRDTWAVGADKVHFSNPNWQDFMVETARKVCSSLGVAPSNSLPQAELYKLLLYEAGSQ